MKLNIEKTIGALLIFCFLALSGYAQGIPKYAAQALSVPGNIAAATTTNLASPQTVGQLVQQNVAISVSCFPISDNSHPATTNLYVFQRSVDGVNWDTNTFNLINFAAVIPTNPAAAGPATCTTNIAVTGYGYIRLSSILTGVLAITNHASSYGVKILSP